MNYAPVAVDANINVAVAQTEKVYPSYQGLQFVIDDIDKSMALVGRMQAALPMRAFTSMELRRTLQEESKRVFPHECSVTEIRYMGDEGGIACHLDFGFSGTKNVHVVSITHLKFDRKNPLAREIESYRKHRIKRLKKLHGGMSAARPG